jgi:hypothetical protein
MLPAWLSSKMSFMLDEFASSWRARRMYTWVKTWLTAGNAMLGFGLQSGWMYTGNNLPADLATF